MKYSTLLKEAVRMFYAQDAEMLLRWVKGRKERAAFDSSGAYTNAAKWDFAKLQYFACKKRKGGVSSYDEVVFVVLKSDGVDFILPDQFPAVEGIGKVSTGMV